MQYRYRKRILKIIELFESNGFAERMSAISEFCRFYADAVPYLKNVASRHLNPTLVAAMRYIEENYISNCGIDELCEAVFVSEPHLYYLFRKEMNTTPIHYRNKFRIEKCAEELRSTDLSEIDIAEQNGFESLSYFRECFKKQLGVTPYRYRKTNKKDI